MKRRARLRTRVTLFFLLASFPAVGASIGAIVLIDREIAAQIQQRTDETFLGVTRGLETDSQRISQALKRLARDDDLVDLAGDVDHDDALDRAENIAAELAAEGGLSIFGVIAARGPMSGQIVSSAHLPIAFGDPAPGFVLADRAHSSTVGVARELVGTNPPELVPVLIAVRPLLDRDGKPALILYGGRRLDVHFLGMLARGGDTSLLLDGPGVKPQWFPPRPSGHAAPRPTKSIRLAALAGEGHTGEDLRLGVAINTTGLESMRQRFALLAAGLIVALLVVALFAGATLSRPIVAPILDLSRAASEIGAGNVDVRVERSRNDEVGELVDVFNQMAAEIADSRVSLARAERIAAWRDAARQVAHEIKNPLTPMRMAMETLRKAYKVEHADLDAIVDESTQAVLDEVRSLSRIVSEFSEFARLPKPRKADVTAAELLEATSRLYGATPTNVAVSVGSADDLPQVMLSADPEQLGRALINLVKNAIEALDDTGGSVTLQATKAERNGKAGVSIEVRDNGPGIPEDVKARLFAPYFTTKTNGTGLGLPIVERIVAEHEGAIDVQSEVGVGTSFKVWLPAA